MLSLIYLFNLFIGEYVGIYDGASISFHSYGNNCSHQNPPVVCEGYDSHYPLNFLFSFQCNIVTEIERKGIKYSLYVVGLSPVSNSIFLLKLIFHGDVLLSSPIVFHSSFPDDVPSLDLAGSIKDWNGMMKGVVNLLERNSLCYSERRIQFWGYSNRDNKIRFWSLVEKKNQWYFLEGKIIENLESIVKFVKCVEFGHIAIGIYIEITF